jgi:hypothetical protein
MVDDSKHLLTDSQKVMERGARFVSDGLLADGHRSACIESEDKQRTTERAREERSQNRSAEAKSPGM